MMLEISYEISGYICEGTWYNHPKIEDHEVARDLWGHLVYHVLKSCNICNIKPVSSQGLSHEPLLLFCSCSPDRKAV